MAALPDVRDPKDTYLRHQQIVNALARRKLEALETAMQEHNEGISIRLRQIQSAQALATPDSPSSSRSHDSKYE